MSRPVVRRARWPFAVAVALSSAWACLDASEITLIEITGSGVLQGQAYLDLDGSGTRTPSDSVLVDAAVALVTTATAEVVEVAVTDTLGAFHLSDVPVGSYRVIFDASVLGDSLSPIGGTTPITVAPGDTSQVQIGASFASLSLEDALVAPVGRRVFTSGIALNARLNFGDGQVHFRGATAFLRGLDVARGTLDPGDSVRLLGRVVEDNGRPALRNVTFFVLIPDADVVAPDEISTAAAATASGGADDAALARIRNAEISDTSTTPEGHFRFWADDGSDSVEVVIRDFLAPTFSTELFRPDTVVWIEEATGLLSPVQAGDGSVRWQLVPRGVSDVDLGTKFADIAVTSAYDTTEATLGDTVEIMVTVRNAGPRPASSLQVRDSIPADLTFVDATATRGSYDEASGLWSLGTLTAGVTDTLRLRAEVVTDVPGVIRNSARSLGPLFEVDPNFGNDAAISDLTVVAPPPPPTASRD